jgi:hypothetical protein
MVSVGPTSYDGMMNVVHHWDVIYAREKAMRPAVESGKLQRKGDYQNRQMPVLSHTRKVRIPAEGVWQNEGFAVLRPSDNQ